MGATSIHVQAVKPGSEIHNFREKELDYVRPELSHLNESWVGDSISHRLESAKQRYFDTVGQKMQTKAAPIREGVIVIKQETTMQELQQFAAVCKERFGIEAFQIHIHKDEGYMNAKQWTPNLHAHVVFDWTQPNGKSVRLSRDDMAELQTIASEALGMERGVSSDRKHLSAMQYKTECAKEQLQELSNDISSALDKHKDVQNQLLQLQKELRSIETKKNVQKLISKASEKFYGLIGKTVDDREKDALKAKIKALEGENEQLSDRLGKAILEKERNGTKVFKAENDKEYYRQQMDNARTTSNRLRTENQELKTETKELKKELGKMKDLFNSEQLEALRHHFPNISKAMEEGKDLLKQITRSRGFGMVATGDAMKKCREFLKDIEHLYNVKYCVIYAVPLQINSVDYFFEIVDYPRFFQWNIMNHSILQKTCMDIDGVLCADPTPEENDDGEKYRHFLLNAPPLFIPKVTIGTLVTSRLEKYRPETEAWLRKNHVKYNKLVMLDLPDMAARQRANCHASFKAKEYGSSTDYMLFVESSMPQAVEINRLTKKPVLCTETFRMIYESKSLYYNLKSGETCPWLRRFMIRVRNRLRALSPSKK